MFRKIRSETINRRYRGKIVLVAALAASLALPAAAAAAGQPTRTKIPDSLFTDSAPAGAVCPFAISVAPLVNNAYNLTYPPDANGDVREIASGHAVVRLTNDETGKSIVPNTTGPQMTVIHPDGSETITLGGPTLLGNLIPPVPGLVVVDGRTVIDQSPSGDQTLVSFTGTVTLDVCAALA
jgi:hypothetical protein